MPWDAIRPMVHEPTFTVATSPLRPGVPIVRVRGRLNSATAGELMLVAGRCLDTSPWALVIDLTGLSDLRAGAVSTLVDLAKRAGPADIGLYLVTSGGAVDLMLDAEAAGLFDIHHSVESAVRALGARS
jgi:anti-anti-sigma regulatory factor